MMTLKKLVQVFFITFAMFGMVGGTLIYFYRANGISKNDFWVYYRTAHRMHDGNWSKIYSLKDGAMPFRYTPPTLLGFAPLAQLKEIPARRVWFTLQALFFSLGFWVLFLVLKKLNTSRPFFWISISYLLVCRYYLDALWCGQVSGIVFFCLSLGLLFWLEGKSSLTSFSLMIPALLKIVPSILFLFILFQSGVKRGLRQVLGVSILSFLILNVLLFFWLSHASSVNFFGLWRDWLSIVISDSHYYDGSVSKSQALRGFLLRSLGPSNETEILWLNFVLLGTLLLASFWGLRETLTHHAKAFSYSLGVLAFVLFMPQSLPYQLVHLAIPMTVLLSRLAQDKDFLSKTTVVLFLIFCSLPGSDVVGFKQAEWIQVHSFPFFVVLVLTLTILTKLRMETRWVSIYFNKKGWEKISLKR